MASERAASETQIRDTLTAEHSKAMADAERAHAARVAELDADVAHLTGERNGLQSDKERLSGDLATTTANLEDMTSKHEAKCTELADTIARMQRERSEAEESAAAAHAQELAEVNAAHADAVVALEETMAEKEAAATERQNELQERFDDIERRFEARESRADDLAKIAGLEDAVMQRDSAIDEMQAQLSKFKGEMMNREASLNKTFGNNAAQLNPAAANGVMDWMLKSKKRDKSARPMR